MDHSQDPPPGSSSGSAGGIASFRDDKQETVVVRPYPQVQALGQPPALPQHVPIQPSPPVTVAAPSVHLLQGQQSSVGEASVKVIYFRFLLSCDFVKILKVPLYHKVTLYSGTSNSIFENNLYNFQKLFTFIIIIITFIELWSNFHHTEQFKKKCLR